MKKFLHDLNSFFCDLGRHLWFKLLDFSGTKVLELVGFAFRQLSERQR
jgi:hypothetical protein